MMGLRIMESLGQEHKTTQKLPPKYLKGNLQYQLATNENQKKKQVRFCFCNTPKKK
jgi:hypothetical protein